MCRGDLLRPSRLTVCLVFIDFPFGGLQLNRSSVLLSLTAQSRRQNLSWVLKIFSERGETPLSSRFFQPFPVDIRNRRGYSKFPKRFPLPKVSFVAHESAGEITRLLQGWRGGDRKALDALLPVVYKELQRLAHFQLRKERPDHTLQSAALVNEAYLRLVGLNAPQWEGRSHFFAIAAQQMRQILVDYARRHRAGKRGGAAETLSLDDTGLLEPGKGRDVDVVALDDALKALAKIDAAQSAGRGAALLRRIELRRDGGGAQSVGDHGGARLEHRTSLAAPRDESWKFRWTLNAGNE